MKNKKSLNHHNIQARKKKYQQELNDQNTIEAMTNKSHKAVTKEYYKWWTQRYVIHHKIDV